MNNSLSLRLHCAAVRLAVVSPKRQFASSKWILINFNSFSSKIDVVFGDEVFISEMLNVNLFSEIKNKK
jgi:hypothetical protein